MTIYYALSITAGMSDNTLTSHIVREKRKALGLSQQELAEMVGVKQPTIARIENGQNISGLMQFALRVIFEQTAGAAK